jgi:hypothetical protein
MRGGNKRDAIGLRVIHLRHVGKIMIEVFDREDTHAS